MEYYIWSIFGPILQNHLNNNMLKTMLWGALLVATSLLNTSLLNTCARTSEFGRQFFLNT